MQLTNTVKQTNETSFKSSAYLPDRTAPRGTCLGISLLGLPCHPEPGQTVGNHVLVKRHQPSSLRLPGLIRPSALSAWPGHSWALWARQMGSGMFPLIVERGGGFSAPKQELARAGLFQQQAATVEGRPFCSARGVILLTTHLRVCERKGTGSGPRLWGSGLASLLSVT